MMTRLLCNCMIFSIALATIFANYSTLAFTPSVKGKNSHNSILYNSHRLEYTVLLLRSTALSSLPAEEITRDKSKEIVDDDDDEADELVDSLTEKWDEMEGLWYSDDFYGPHGREWVKISASLVTSSSSAAVTSALVAVKVTGDPNVPAGCETFKTSSWPSVGEKVPAAIQVRADPNDPNGFEWIPGELSLVDKDQIRLMCQFNMFMRSEGTFYKQKEDGSEE